MGSFASYKSDTFRLSFTAAYWTIVVGSSFMGAQIVGFHWPHLRYLVTASRPRSRSKARLSCFFFRLDHDRTLTRLKGQLHLEALEAGTDWGRQKHPPRDYLNLNCNLIHFGSLANRPSHLLLSSLGHQALSWFLNRNSNINSKVICDPLLLSRFFQI